MATLGTAFVEIRGDASRLKGDIDAAKKSIIQRTKETEEEVRKIEYEGGKKVADFRSRMNQQQLSEIQRLSKQIVDLRGRMNQQQLKETQQRYAVGMDYAKADYEAQAYNASRATKLAQQQAEQHRANLNNQIKYFQQQASEAELSAKKQSTAITKSAQQQASAIEKVHAEANRMNKEFNNTASLKTYQASISAQRESLLRNAGSMNAVHEAANRMNKQFDGLSRGVKGIGGDFWALTAGILKSAPAFAVATGAIGAVYAGLRLLKDTFVGGLGAIEDYKLKVASMAAFITTFADKSQEGGDVAKIYQRATVEAKNLVSALEILDARTIATGRDLTTIAEGFIKGGIQLNLTNEKTKQGFVNIANALKLLTAGQNQEVQMRQEIRALINGELKQTNVLVKTLQAIDPEIKKHLETWKQQGTTIENIGMLLNGFSYAAVDIESTWSAIGTSLTTIKDRVLREGMLPIYQDLLKIANDIRYSFIDQNGDLTETAKILQEKIRSGWEDIKSAVSGVIGSIKEINRAVEFTASLFDNKFGLVDLIKLMAELKIATLAWNLVANANPILRIATVGLGLTTQIKGWSEATALFSQGMISGTDLLKSVLTFSAPSLVEKFNKDMQGMATGGSAAIDIIRKKILTAQKEMRDIVSGGFNTASRKRYAELEKQVGDYILLTAKLQKVSGGEKQTKPLDLSKMEFTNDLRAMATKLEEQIDPIKKVRNEYASMREEAKGLYESQKSGDERTRVSKEEYLKIISSINVAEKEAVNTAMKRSSAYKEEQKDFKEWEKAQEKLKTIQEEMIREREKLQDIKIQALPEQITIGGEEVAIRKLAEINDKYDKIADYISDISFLTAEEVGYYERLNELSRERDLNEETYLKRQEKSLAIQREIASQREDLKNIIMSSMKEEDRGIAEINDRYDKTLEDVSNKYYLTAEEIINAEKIINDARQRAIRDLEYSQNRAVDISKTVAEEFKNNFTDALLSLRDGFEGFGKFVEGILNSIIRRIIEVKVSMPIANAVSDTNWLSTVGTIAASFFGSENGNAFVGGRVQAFANGGIIDKPTFFNSSKGASVAGEAGTEAILPLKRGRSGDLGVDASGMSNVQNNIIIQTPAGTQATTQESNNKTGGKDIQIIIEEIVAKGIRGRGPIRTAMNSTFPQLSQPTVRR